MAAPNKVERMPLPKPETNWAARIVVLLICGAAIAIVAPVVWLLGSVNAPDFIVYPVLAIWFVTALLSALWVVSVWAPVRGMKVAERILKTPWILG